jgi:hypothetical protein
MAHHGFYGVGAQEKEKQKEEVGRKSFNVPLIDQLFCIIGKAIVPLWRH